MAFWHGGLAEMEPHKHKHRFWIICLILALGTFLIYFQAVQNDFVNYDDPDYVTLNPHVQDGLNLQGVAWAFTTDHAANWHPLTWISHMLDSSLFGANPAGHHLTSLLLHIANTLLLFGFLFRTTGFLWRSAFVSALFTWHPLHVESVAWIAERKDVLSTFFWLLTMLAYVGYTKKPEFKRYLLTLSLFALGLLSKPMVVTLPFALLLLDYWPLNRIARSNAPTSGRPVRNWKQLVLEKIPFLLLSFVSSAITFIVQKKGGSVVRLESLPLIQRLENVPVAYFRYVWKMFFPTDLAVIYPFQDWTSLQVAAAIIFLLAVTAAALFTLRSRPYFLVGWLWFLGTLVPVIGIVQVGLQSMADRYTYIPLIGLFIVATWGLAGLIAKFQVPQRLVSLVAILLLLACSTLTWLQLQVWNNSVSLNKHAIEVTQNNLVARQNLGFIYCDLGQYDQALNEFSLILKSNPNDAYGLMGMGMVCAAKEDHDNALKYFNAALANKIAKPAVTHLHLGNVFFDQGKFSEATTHYSEALSIQPDFLEAHHRMGLSLLKLNQPRDAIEHFNAELKVRSALPNTHLALAECHQKLGDLNAAISHCRDAIRLNPDLISAHELLGTLLVRQANSSESQQPPTGSPTSSGK